MAARRMTREEREALRRGREAAEKALREALTASRAPRNRGEMIRRIFRGEVPEARVARRPWTASVVHAHAETVRRPEMRGAMERLLLQVERVSDLFEDHPPRRLGGGATTWLPAVIALGRHHGAWIRPIETWVPGTHNAARQFASLARHLLAKFAVPAFMDGVWFLGDDPEALRRQCWFAHLGAGKNIRVADIPLAYTGRMAHHFGTAPGELTVDEALRWGQVHGMGGDARLARALFGTRLVDAFEQDEFWSTVIQFLIRNPMLDTRLVGPIVDYVHHRKYAPQDVFVRPGVVEQRPPPEPEFSMKGRTVPALLRRVEEWHQRLAQERRRGGTRQWKLSGIRPFRHLEGERGKQRRWTIEELLDARALSEEGNAMRHCVSSYDGSCAAGIVSIWSMRLDTGAGPQRVLTVEVENRAREIRQARGFRNDYPDPDALRILQRWAVEAGLTIASYL